MIDSLSIRGEMKRSKMHKAGKFRSRALSRPEPHASVALKGIACIMSFVRAIPAVFFAFFAIVPFVAHAAIAPWATSEGGRMRLVALSQPRNGIVTALVQIEPKDGWKTYWRNPGDAGMAPELDFSGSTNLQLKSVFYPVPEIGRDEAGRFIGYHRPVSLVVEFEKPDEAAPSAISLKALVGICETICLPFTAEFKLALDPGIPEGEEFSALMMAQAELPEKPRADFAVRSLMKSADGKSLVANVLVPDATLVEAAAAASRGVSLGKDPSITVESHNARFVIPVKRIEPTGEPHQITLLVKSGKRAIETTLALD
jgi:DsbC/DsbD-like thiol-disulfide interchange protein